MEIVVAIIGSIVIVAVVFLLQVIPDYLNYVHTGRKPMTRKILSLFASIAAMILGHVIRMGVYKAEIDLAPGDTVKYFVAGNGIRRDRTMITRGAGRSLL